MIELKKMLIQIIINLANEYSLINGKIPDTILISEINIIALMKEAGMFEPENYWKWGGGFPVPLPNRILGMNVEIDNNLEDTFAILLRKEP